MSRGIARAARAAGRGTGRSVGPAVAWRSLACAFALAGAAPSAADRPSIEVTERLDALAASASELRDRDAEAGLALAEQALQEAREAGYRRGELAAELARGENLNVLGRNEEAIEAFDAAIAGASAAGDAAAEVDLRINALRRKGVSLFDLGRMEAALAAYLESLRLAEQHGLIEDVAKAAANIGNVYWKTDDLVRASEYQERARAAFHELGHLLGEAGTSLNLAAVQSDLARAAAAQGDLAARDEHHARHRELNLRALEIFEELEIPRGVASALSNLGNNAAGAGRLDEAAGYARRALEIRRALGDRLGEANSLNLLGVYALGDGRRREADSLFDEAEAVAREIDAPDQLATILASRLELHRSLGRWREAYETLVELSALDQRLRSDEVQARLAELELRYESEKRAREIEALRSESEIARLAARGSRTLRNASLAVSGLVLALLAATYSRYRLGRTVNAELHRMAHTDALTGLANRRAMLEALALEASRFDRTGQAYSLVLCDLDDFKAINDRHGHEVGDRALARVAAYLRRSVRAHDLVGRWGGEEFLVLLPATDAAGARSVAESLRRGVPEGGDLAEPPVRPRATLGVATAEPGEPPEAALRRADAALLEAKRAGKDRVGG